jgi:DNA-binding NarL/FixJ family response regulator
MHTTIALADDHQLVRKGIRLLLEDIGKFKVIIEAGNGRELIDLIEEASALPELVLVDVNMPVMNGFDTVLELKEKFPELKMIALSVNDELHIIRDMIKAGANAYLFKDSSPEMFEKVLREVSEKGFYYSKSVVDSLISTEKGPAMQRSSEQDQLQNLSNREREFIKLCCSEMTYKEIADIMNVSQRTVDGYRESTFDKLNIKSRTGVVLFAFRSGLSEIF